MKRTPLLLALLCAAMLFTSCKKDEESEETPTPTTPTVGWTKMNSSITQPLMSVAFYSDQIGYAVGDWGKVLKTEDGGQTWTQKAITNVSQANMEVELIDAQTLFVITFSGIYKSTNGGTSWNEIYPNLASSFLKDVEFTTSTVGFLATLGSIAKTTDGGATWTDIASTVMTNGWRQLEFPSSDIGYAIGKNGMIKTTNGGDTWNTLAIPMAEPSFIYFKDNNVGWIGSSMSGNDTILSTIDGGTTWNVKTQTSLNTIMTICFVDGQTGYAGMSGGGVKATSNSGTTWSSVSSPAGNTTINRFCFRNASLGWAVGDNGLIMKYK
jgi:photosystem II stability/assembly factor-like uncharacterized protein